MCASVHIQKKESLYFISLKTYVYYASAVDLQTAGCIASLSSTVCSPVAYQSIHKRARPEKANLTKKDMAVMFILNLLEIITTIVLLEYLFNRGFVEKFTFGFCSVFLQSFYSFPRLDTGTSIVEPWVISISCFVYPAALIDNIKSVKDIIFVVTIHAAYVTMSCMLPIVIGDVDNVFPSWLYSYICVYVSLSIYFKAIRSNIIQQLFSKDVLLSLLANIWILTTSRRVLYKDAMKIVHRSAARTPRRLAHDALKTRFRCVLTAS